MQPLRGMGGLDGGTLGQRVAGARRCCFTLAALNNLQLSFRIGLPSKLPINLSRPERMPWPFEPSDALARREVPCCAARRRATDLPRRTAVPARPRRRAAAGDRAPDPFLLPGRARGRVREPPR